MIVAALLVTARNHSKIYYDPKILPKFTLLCRLVCTAVLRLLRYEPSNSTLLDKGEEADIRIIEQSSKKSGRQERGHEVKEFQTTPNYRTPRIT